MLDWTSILRSEAMKILITGAAGFVGKNLVAALKEIACGHDKREDHTLDFTIHVVAKWL